MQCPLHDGELLSHTTHGTNRLVVMYSTCPTCRGYWMSSFAANYIRTVPSESPLPTHRMFPVCPQCQALLIRHTGENIPDMVTIYTCPHAHGYFFPTGQLFLFKKAQATKLAYHKQWHIPLPGVASVLLAGILVFILFAFQLKQTTTSQAHAIFAAPHAYVVQESRRVLVTVETAKEEIVTLHVPELSYQKEMGTSDGKLHTIVVEVARAGIYTYYFTAQSFSSEHFHFTMP